MRPSTFFILSGLVAFFWFIGLPVISWIIGVFGVINVIETDLDRRAGR
jgi:hypothetical protein